MFNSQQSTARMGLLDTDDENAAGVSNEKMSNNWSPKQENNGGGGGFGALAQGNSREDAARNYFNRNLSFKHK